MPVLAAVAVAAMGSSTIPCRQRSLVSSHSVVRVRVATGAFLPRSSCRSSLFGQQVAAQRTAAGAKRLASRLRAATPVRASFFGVGAPEAVLVGVVALVLFGPKGLAQAAKSVGATLRAFAPTIRELTQVSTELKSSLEQEIGLNDLREEFQRPVAPAPRPASMPSGDEEGGGPTSRSGPGESGSLSELTASMQRGTDAAAIDPDIERKREAAARAAWGPPPSAGGGARAAAPAVAALSVEELEAELARRKAAASSVPQNLSANE